MKMPYRIIQIDAVKMLSHLPDESVDLIITDPAYESMEKHRKIGTTTRLTGQWFDIFTNERFLDLLTQMYRVLKKNTHAYIFCDEETRDVLKPISIEAGFTFQKSLPWFKEMRGTGYNYPVSHEYIAFLKKGKRKLNTNNHLDVLRYKAIRNGYPTEKPVPLLDVLVTESSNVGDLVVDPFCGSGSTGESAMKNFRNFMGGDTADRAVQESEERLGEIYQNMRKFIGA